jgi:membrane protein YqaA with SNARE-associated domain
MDFVSLLGTHGVLATTLFVCLVGALVPVVNVEVYLLVVASVAPRTALAPVVLLAALGQMVGKTALYYGGRHAPRMISKKSSEKLDRVRVRFENGRVRGDALVLLSAVTGLPSFYIVSVVAGVLRLRIIPFLVYGFAGRTARFAAVVWLPQLVRYAMG